MQQGVCTPEGADLAMKLGVNYPQGPFEFLAGWDATAIATLLDRLDAHYRGERYRVSPELRRRAWSRGSVRPSRVDSFAGAASAERRDRLPRRRRAAAGCPTIAGALRRHRRHFDALRRPP